MWQDFRCDFEALGRWKALDLVAIGRSRALPSRELVIERGDLVQPIDDLLVSHRGCVATSPFRLFAEERMASVETVVFGSFSSVPI
jgi:hypothetical protein